MLRFHHYRLLLGSAVAALLVSCASERPASLAPPRPDWISDPMMDGQFGAVGVAPRSVGGQQQSLDQATAAARSELARSLSVTVESAYKDAFASAADWKGKDSSRTARELTDNVTHQVSSQVLVGSHRRAIWEDPGTGEIYVWIGVERNEMLSTRIDRAARSALESKGITGTGIAQKVSLDLAHDLQ